MIEDTKIIVHIVWWKYIFSTNIYIVSLYSPIGSALGCEASVLLSIHSFGELKEALRGPTTFSNPVGIVDWGGDHIHESQDMASVEQHDLRIKALNMHTFRELAE